MSITGNSILEFRSFFQEDSAGDRISIQMLKTQTFLSGGQSLRDFVDLYFRARVLVDPKHITTSLRITAIDEVTNLEAANPKLRIIETGDVIEGDASGIILWKPAQNGDFCFSKVSEGLFYLSPDNLRNIFKTS